MLLHLAYIHDGYLAGATKSDLGDCTRYWADLADEEGFTIETLDTNDRILTDQLCRQGTSDQFYDDGYDAANAVAVAMEGKG